MFLVIWEFEIKPECEERFAKVYGPGGDWVRLFSNDVNYQKTLLVKDPLRAHLYLTLDFWNTAGTYESFKQRFNEAYMSLDGDSEGLTLFERHIGSFESVNLQAETPQ